MKKRPLTLSQLVFLLLVLFSASGLVNAKVASGHQNLGSGLHQGEAVFNLLLHQGKTQSSYDDASGSSVVAKGADDFVDGYRAVSKAEADDIAKHGFRPNPNGQSMLDKWFSETRTGADKFKQNYPDLDTVIKTKVPRNVYDRSYKHPNIDNTGPGFCVSCDDLKFLK